MEEVQRDIARERELLDRARGHAEAARAAQEAYTRQRRHNAEWLAPERERLAAEVTQLRLMVNTFTGHERRISDAWSHYLDVLVKCRPGVPAVSARCDQAPMAAAVYRQGPAQLSGALALAPLGSAAG